MYQTLEGKEFQRQIVSISMIDRQLGFINTGCISACYPHLGSVHCAVRRARRKSCCATKTDARNSRSTAEMSGGGGDAMFEHRQNMDATL